MWHAPPEGMTRDRVRGYCPRCRHQQLFDRTELHHGLHFFLSIITFGLWLVSWASIYIGHRFRPWRCQQCGWHRPMFERPTTTPDSSSSDENPPASSLS